MKSSLTILALAIVAITLSSCGDVTNNYYGGRPAGMVGNCSPRAQAAYATPVVSAGVSMGSSCPTVRRSPRVSVGIGSSCSSGMQVGLHLCPRCHHPLRGPVCGYCHLDMRRIRHRSSNSNCNSGYYPSNGSCNSGYYPSGGSGTWGGSSYYPSSGGHSWGTSWGGHTQFGGTLPSWP